MKKHFLLYLLCFMLAFVPALAESTVPEATTSTETTDEALEAVPAEVQRTRILIYQGLEKSGIPQAELAVLTTVPDLAFDYVVYYDQGHLSVCDLTAVLTYEERLAKFNEWSELVVSHHSRNTVHATPWEALLQADPPMDPALMDVVWVPTSDATPEELSKLAAPISRLVACGGTLQVFDATNGLVLSSALSTFVNTQIIPVENTAFCVVDSLMKDAGYHHVNEEITDAMVRNCEVHPLDGMNGYTLLLESTPAYQLIGNACTYGGLSFTYAPSTQGIAILPAEAIEETSDKDDPEVEGGNPPISPQTNYAITSDEATADGTANGEIPAEGEEPVDSLTLLLQELFSTHQICWYFNPTDDLRITTQVDTTAIPHNTNEQIAMRISLATAPEYLFETNLCTADLSDATAAYQLGAEVVDGQGQVHEAAISASEEPGIYDITFQRLAAGDYTLKTFVQWNGMDYRFTSFDTPIVFEAPLPVSARPQNPIRLTVSPLLWHNGKDTATIEGSTLFNGSFEPIKCMTLQDEWVQVDPNGASFQVTAAKEGRTSLLFVAADEENKVVVPVQILNGTKLVIAEGIALLAALLLVLYVALFTRSHKPRFRYNEQLHIDIDGNQSVVVPLNKYLASGVTLWRLMVIGGCAKEYAMDSAYLKHIRLLPKLDRIIIKNNKMKDDLTAHKEYALRSDNHTYTIVLTTQE